MRPRRPRDLRGLPSGVLSQSYHATVADGRGLPDRPPVFLHQQTAAGGDLAGGPGTRQAGLHGVPSGGPLKRPPGGVHRLLGAKLWKQRAQTHSKAHGETSGLEFVKILRN